MTYTLERAYVIVYIRASRNRLQREAERIGYKCKLDPRAVRQIAHQGVKVGGKMILPPFYIPHAEKKEHSGGGDPYDHIHSAYTYTLGNSVADLFWFTVW